MLRCMYSGVSGLSAHMNKMDIIGNNIANVNTTGYKRSRATFKTMFSQTLQGASAPQESRGGTNPQQIGLGVSLGSIDVDMDQGNLQATGRNSDLAIDGNGFFVLNAGGRNVYTRAGATTFDQNGYLVNSTNGLRVQGWMADANGKINSNEDLKDITLKPSMAARATDEIIYDGNLDTEVPAYTGAEYPPKVPEALKPGATDADKKIYNEAMENITKYEGSTRSIPMTVFDSKGSKHTVNIDITKDKEDNQWTYTVTSIVDSFKNNETLSAGGTGKIKFDSNGNFESGNTVLSFNPEDGAADPLEIELNFSNLTQYAGKMTADGATITGYQAGSIQKYSIDSSGAITGLYDNGKRQTLGKIAVANFKNPAGLTQEGDTMFAESNNSGQAKIGEPGIGSSGTLKAATLEMSNVDLSREFTEMITTQRGFQANSKTISTGDQILQELVNLKR